jgi:membrane protein
MTPADRPAAHIIKRAYLHWRAHNPTLLAAGLSYFALFSLLPLTVLTIILVGRIFAGSNAREFVIAEIADIFSADAANSISTLLFRAERSAGSASVASGVILAWVGSRLFTQLQIALSSVWDLVPEKRSRFGKVKAYIGNRLRAMAATLGFGLLAFAFLVTDLMLASIRHFLVSTLPTNVVYSLLPAASLALSLLLFALAFATIYRWLPASHPGWPAVWSGATVASVLFAVGRVALTVYFHRWNLLSLFGAAGSVAVLLIWVYYSMQILLFGATVAAVVGEKKQNPLRVPVGPP